MVEDNYLGCYVHVRVKTCHACSLGCTGGNSPSKGTSDANTGLSTGDEMLLVFFLGGGGIFGLLFFINHKKGKEGWDRIPARSFWAELP